MLIKHKKSASVMVQWIQQIMRISLWEYSQCACSTCSFKSVFFEKRLRQVLQWNGKLSEWVCIWNFRLDILLKARLHWLHRNGFSPVWIMMWLRRLPFWWKPLPQMSQMKAFLSLCVRRCVLRVDDRLKLFPHSSHLCGFFSVWMILCRQRVLDRRNPFPQTLHTNGRLLVWSGIFKWIDRVYLVLKTLPHWLHLWTVLSERFFAPVPFSSFALFIGGNFLFVEGVTRFKSPEDELAFLLDSNPPVPEFWNNSFPWRILCPAINEISLRLLFWTSFSDIFFSLLMKSSANLKIFPISFTRPSIRTSAG